MQYPLQILHLSIQLRTLSYIDWMLSNNQIFDIKSTWYYNIGWKSVLYQS